MPDAKPIIGIVMPLGHQQGGAEALLMHLLRAGSKRFQFSCVFLKDGPLVEQAAALGFSTCVCPITHLSDPGNYLATIHRLRRWIKREKPKAILSWMPKAHFYVAPAAFFSGAKTLWFQHGISQKGKMDRITTLLPASRILCCSAAAKVAQDRLTPRRWSTVCYPGVPFPSAEPIPMIEAREQLGLDPDGTFVGMVARWERWKGALVFIEAARIIAAAQPKTRFFIVGGAHPLDLAYADEIRSVVAASGLGDRLILAGQRPADEVPLWHASADLIIHPVTGEEPFGMAVVEAMGMGKVVVASDAGGPTEIIANGVNGFLVPRGDAELLASTIMQLLKEPATMERVGAAAYARGREFSVAHLAERIDEILEETLAH